MRVRHGVSLRTSHFVGCAGRERSNSNVAVFEQMNSGLAIEYALKDTALGLASGTFIDYLLPRVSASVSEGQLAFEVAMQAALNGLVIAAVVPLLKPELDPSMGIPFYAGLLSSQPSFSARLETASLKVKERAAQLGLQMGVPTLGVPSTTVDPVQ